MDESMMALKWMDKSAHHNSRRLHDHQGSLHSSGTGRTGGDQEASGC